jgi:hypothetical protein
MNMKADALSINTYSPAAGNYMANFSLSLFTTKITEKGFLGFSTIIGYRR